VKFEITKNSDTINSLKFTYMGESKNMILQSSITESKSSSLNQSSLKENFFLSIYSNL
jgi:uncharacterized protein YgiM (DUF1202 family)